jgi:6-phosphofructokinase 1
MQNRTIWLDERTLSGILTVGGTILGTSRDKPHAMPVAGKTMDMTALIVDHYQQHHLDALVCLGGGGTQKNAFHLMKQGLNIITLPKTIDNDVAMTDSTIGFDTALGIATEAIDRLHSTAHSHHRIIVVEVMGHRAGWLALGAGVAGGADVILTPEIPYDIDRVSEAILKRSRGEKRFSIVCVAEGAMSIPEAAEERRKATEKQKARAKAQEDSGGDSSGKKKDRKKNKAARAKEGDAEAPPPEADSPPDEPNIGGALILARKLEKRTGLESRVTILGHLQRGGTPSAADRFLGTRLGTECANLIHKGCYGVMVAARGDGTEPVPLEEVAGKRKAVPLDHPWYEAARAVGTSLGD